MNQKGQTLIFVLFVMVIALAVGISISSRTVSTVRRTTNVDTSARALAAAEAATEYYLAKTYSELVALTATGSCNTPVQVNGASNPYSVTSTDNIPASALVWISRTGCASRGQAVSYEIDQSDIVELNLSRNDMGSLSIDWAKPTTAAAIKPSLYIVMVYNKNEGLGTEAYESQKIGYNQGSDNYNSNNFESTSCDSDSCQITITVGTGQLGGLRLIRFQSLYNSSKLVITPSGFDLGFQSFTIKSVGTAGAGQQVKRTVTATKSIPYLPGLFNYAIFSNTGGLSQAPSVD